MHPLTSSLPLDLLSAADLLCSLQEGIDAISNVIHHVETFDVTTIRASTPMFLMSRKIKALGVKMVLSGEGADEVFGGYLYFHKAPNKVGRMSHAARGVGSSSSYTRPRTPAEDGPPPYSC